MLAAGAPVGAVGSTGRPTGPHLHYETRVAGPPIDPVRLLQIGADLYGLSAGTPIPQPSNTVHDTQDG
ncbi:M23 family metallopeptidase [Methylobacterium nodulans]|uniref:M23 family metallopeptidase n=1 Tax=Methylobacterium nodulans TaxID=114616 RepID=UPI0001619486|nr:M23 family metallopeptidase [Methylobacterium nodulans]